MPAADLLLAKEPHHQVLKCIRHLNIHSTSKIVLQTLDSYRNVTTGAPGYPSVRKMARDLHVSDKTIQRHVALLVEQGYLRRQPCFQPLENGGIRQTTNYYYVTKLVFGGGCLTLKKKITAIVFPKMVLPNNLKRLPRKTVKCHPPRITNDVPMNYINTNDPNLEQKTIFLNTTNTSSRDSRGSSIETISNLMADVQAVVDAVPKADPLKEAQATELLRIYEQGMGMIAAVTKQRFVEAYVRCERDYERDVNTMTRLVTDEVFWRPTLTSPARLFFADAMLVNKRRTEDKIRRGLLECGNMGLGYERILMDDDVRRWFANNERAAWKAIEYCMQRDAA